MAGERVGLDTATRMLERGDTIGRRGESAAASFGL
jgi:hypothetical protein